MKIKSKIRFLVMLLLCSILLVSPLNTFAEGGTARENLITIIQSGSASSDLRPTYDINVTSNRYKRSDGGYYTYIELATGEYLDGAVEWLDTEKLNMLKSGERNKFLKDVFKVINVATYDADNGATGSDDNSPDSAAAQQVMTEMQNMTGEGTQLLTTLMADTKPDFVTASHLYTPFSGVIGTILGVICILIMAFLAITMALDLAYITIPAFQLACGGESNNGNGEKKGGIGGVISQEAHWATEEANGKQGSTGQDGSGHKAAVGIYFKYRWKGLVLLGICLLYLVQGQIFTLIGAIIDLLSGFLGF